MTPTPGTHTLGPATTDLLLFTTVEGAMARMGHALTLVVTDWSATVTLGTTPEECGLQVSAKLDSLRVKDSSGGAKPISDKDRGDIEKNIIKALDPGRHPELHFSSTNVTGSWDEVTLQGQLELNDQTQLQVFTISDQGKEYLLSGDLVQSRFGIKPFSTMMGALKVGDTVGVQVRASL